MSRRPSAFQAQSGAFERMLIQSTLWETGGNVLLTSEILQVHRGELYKRMQRLGIPLPALGQPLRVAGQINRNKTRLGPRLPIGPGFLKEKPRCSTSSPPPSASLSAVSGRQSRHK